MKKDVLKYLFIGLCIAIVIAGHCIPTVGGISTAAFAVIGTFIGCILLWIFHGLEFASILCLVSLGFIPEIGFSNLFKASFGSDTTVFLLFTFMLTYAVSNTSLIKNVSIFFLTNKLSRKSPWAFVILYTISIMLLGMIMSPTVLFVALLPLAKQILKLAGIEQGEKVGAMLIMILGFTVSISSGMTPIAHIFPIIALGQYSTFTGLAINYFQYMSIAIPVGLTVIALMLVCFRFILKPNLDKLKNINFDELKTQKQEVTGKDKIVIGVFLGVVLLWLLPSVFQFTLPELYKIWNGWGLAFPAMVGVLILALVTHNKKPILSIMDASKNGVPWTSLIMCAATLGLGFGIANDAIGIKQLLIDFFSTSFSSAPLYVLLMVFSLWSIVQTNFGSSMVTSTIVSAVSVPMLFVLSPTYGAIVAILVGELSAFSYATPPAMPHIALINESGYTTPKKTFTYGMLMVLISWTVALSVGFGLGTIVF